MIECERRKNDITEDNRWRRTLKPLARNYLRKHLSSFSPPFLHSFIPSTNSLQPTKHSITLQQLNFINLIMTGEYSPFSSFSTSPSAHRSTRSLTLFILLFHLTDAGRQSATDKATSAMKPDSEKGIMEKGKEGLDVSVLSSSLRSVLQVTFPSSY